eukprot:CAMPEP_0197843652 /NCGR_PEP_ID=MMETSP1438-20131217/558_1 /TAXON_ID=1461541 /ORGANISM="Pterosperma sp., Strain CCMP1384" /LENGTH=346 /DNA_ID=CAMNT_0043453941 /DNA_START=60 /DNA_END=1100 /DNA_ORIENTATION=+
MKFAAAVSLALLSGANAQESAFKKADGVLAGSYPATFPFENDNYVSVATIPGSDGHDTIDPESNDIGGYAAISYHHCNIFEYEPFGVYAGGPSPCARVYQRLFFSYWSTPYGDLIPINCTQAKVIIEGPFDGNFPGSDQVCEPASCCSYANGHVHLTKEWESQQEKWGQRYQKYGCTWMTEASYCQILHFNVNWCHEYYEYAREQGNKQVRPFMQPCINLFDYFLSQCSNFKALGAKPLLQALKIEPDPYLNSISSAEANTALAVFYANDHVCTPIAEVHPDLFKKEAAPTDAPASGGSTPAASTPSTPAASTPAASSSDDAAGMTQVPVVVLGAVASIFAAFRFY